jgi:hypothetical protein
LSNFSFLKEECKAYLPRGYQRLAVYRTLDYFGEVLLKAKRSDKREDGAFFACAKRSGKL